LNTRAKKSPCSPSCWTSDLIPFARKTILSITIFYGLK